MMSVQNVQSFNDWFAALKPEQVAGKNLSELRAMYAQEQANLTKGLTGNGPDNAGVGTQVARTEEKPGDAEKREARAEANKGALADIEAQKRAAALQQVAAGKAAEKEAGKYAPLVMEQDTRALVDQMIKKSGSDKPLYQNKKARKELEDHYYRHFLATRIGKEVVADYTKKYNEAKTPEEKQKLLEEFADKKDAARKYAKTMVKDVVNQDKIEHTRVFDSKADKKEFEKTNKDDTLLLKTHKQKFIDDQNQKLHLKAEANGTSLHQEAFEMVDNVSGDRRFEPNEYKNVATKAGLGDEEAAVKAELKRLGYDVKDDTWKNIGKSLAVFAGGAAGGTSLPVLISAAADAIVGNPVTGTIYDEAHDSADKTYFPWKNGLIAGGVASVVAAALFGETKDEDVLHGVGVQEVFADVKDDKGNPILKDGKPVREYETMEFGKHKNSENVKMVLRAIDELELTDEQKTQFLIEAAGEDGQRILSSKELIIAYMNAAKPVEPEQEVKEVIEAKETNAASNDGNEQPKPLPEYKAPLTGGQPDKKPVQVETGLPHRANELYGDILARAGYVRADGKKLTDTQVKELINHIYDRNEVRRKGADGKTKYVLPKTWALTNTITLKDNTVVNLKPYEDLVKIKAKETENDANLGFDKTKSEIKTEYQTVTTPYGFQVQEKKPGEEKWTVVYDSSSENKTYTDADKAREAADLKKQEFEDAAKKAAENQE